MRVTFDDGKYVDFEGDDDVSDEDIAWAEQQVYGNTPVKKSSPTVSQALDSLPGGFWGPKDVVGDLEAGVSIVSAAPSFLGKGLTYLGTLAATGGDTQAAAEVSDATAEKIAKYTQYEPRSTRGKEASEAFMWGQQKLVEGGADIGEKLGGNLGRLIGGVGTEFATIIAPISPARGPYGRSKPRPTEANNIQAKAQEIMAENKAKAEVSKPTPEAPKIETPLPELLPELRVEAADYPPLLPESPIKSPVDTPLPILENTPVPILPKRGRRPSEPEGVLPVIDEHLLSEKVPGIEVSPIQEITISRGPRGKQKGVVNPEVFAEGFQKIYELANRGLKMTWTSKSDNVTGWKEAQLVVTDKSDKVVADAMVRPNTANNLEVDMVKTYGEGKGKNIPELMYLAMAKSGDVQRSSVQTPPGKVMWDRFEQQGLTDSTGQIIPNRLNQSLSESGIESKERQVFIKAMKGQSGQIDVGGGSIGKIADYITKVRKSKESSSPLFDHEKQIAAMTKIPGMEMSAYIPKDAPVDAVKKDLSSLPDIPDSGYGDLFIASKDMQASIKRNPAMYAVGQWFTNARKRFELYDTVALHPLERDFSNAIRKQEAGALMAVMKEESYAKMRFTPEQLNELLNPSQVELYTKLRTEFDNALAKQNKTLEENGQKAITPHEAYISSRWGGQWRSPVFDKKGNIVWWIAETTKPKAAHALEWIKKKEPDLDFSRSKIEYKNQSMGMEGKETLQGYREMLKVLDGEAPLTKRLQELYEEKLAQEGYRAYGHDKHFEPKGGTKGFAGERPWINDAKDIRAFYESQMSYLRESYLWSEQQAAVANTKKLLYDTEFQKSHQNTLDWVRQTARNEMGSDTSKTAIAIEHSLAKALKTSPSSLNKIVSGTKSYFYSTKLGFFNAPFAVMSVVQPVFVLPHHIRLSDQGFKHNGLKTLMDSMVMTAGTILPKIAGDAISKKQGPVAVPQLYRDAFKYMEANGIVNLNQFSDVGHVNRSQAHRKILDVVNYSITAPEKIARTTSFMGFVSHLEQSGKFKGDDLGMFQKAETLTNLALANFKHTERASAFNKMGVAGNALVTLQTFKINQLNQLYDFGKGAAKGEGIKPFAAMMGIQIAMAGTMGFYGMEQAEWMWKWIKKGLNEAGIYDENLMEFSPKKWMLENMPSLLSMGVMSQVMGGKDYHTRLDQGTILDPTMAGVLPFVTDLVEQGKDVVTALADPTQEKIDRAALSVTPSSLKGAVEMGAETLTGAPGQGDAFSVDKPKEPLYKRTQADKEARGTPFHGVPTLTESREKMAAFKRRETEGLRDRQLAIQTEKFNAASRMGNDEDKVTIIRKIAALGGDWEAILKSEIAKLEARATTADEKSLLRATDSGASLQLLLKVKRQLEATRKLRENN